MSQNKKKGTFQLANGMWGFRFSIIIDGIKKDVKRTKDEFGNPLKTEKAAIKAREQALKYEHANRNAKPVVKRYTVDDVYQEYCKNGRFGKAYGTIRKQDSLWRNHLSARYGKRTIDSITVSEINDYLSFLYHEEQRAYQYVQGFLKMFYLIFGQAYSKNILDVDKYNTLCVNKNTKIHMPKMKADEDTDIKCFDRDELSRLDEYFKDTNAETAYLLGRYCGLRINECYGLKWSDIDFDNDCINIERQMQYQDGLIKLVRLKTRNAKRKVYMGATLKQHLFKVKQSVDESNDKLILQRKQNQTMIYNTNDSLISSLALVNTLPNGKIQTVNSMKYHAKTIKKTLGIHFKYHYLRHTYGTILAELNTPTHILCNQMGHGSPVVTQKYYLAISKQGIDIIKEKANKL